MPSALSRPDTAEWMGGMGGTEGGTDGGTGGATVAHGDAERATDATRWPASGWGRRWRCRIVAYLIGIRATQGGSMGEGMGRGRLSPMAWAGGSTASVAVRAWRAHELVATPVEFVDGRRQAGKARHAGHFVTSGWVGICGVYTPTLL